MIRNVLFSVRLSSPLNQPIMNGANSRKDRNKILNLENMNLGEGKEIGPSDILRRISQLSPRR